MSEPVWMELTTLIVRKVDDTMLALVDITRVISIKGEEISGQPTCCLYLVNGQHVMVAMSTDEFMAKYRELMPDVRVRRMEKAEQEKPAAPKE